MADPKARLAPVLSLDEPGEAAFTIERSECRHELRGFRVEPDSRTIRCRDCDTVVDAYDALLSYAKRWDSWKLHRDRLARERMLLRTEVDRLKAQRARLRREIRKETNPSPPGKADQSNP